MTSVRKLPGMDSLVKTAAALSRSATNMFRGEQEPIPGMKPAGKLPEWKVMCQEAKELAQKGEKEEALMLYHRALRMRPNAPEIKTAIRNLTSNITDTIQASKTMKLFSTMKMMAHKKKTRKSSITGAELLGNLQEEEREASAKSLLREKSLMRDNPPPIKPTSNTRILPPIGQTNTEQPTTQAPPVPAIAINDETIQTPAGIERQRTTLTLAKPLSDINDGSSGNNPGGADNGEVHQGVASRTTHTPEPTNKDNPPGAALGVAPGSSLTLEAPGASPRSARRKRSSRHKGKKAEVVMPPLVFKSLQSLQSEGGGGVSSRASSRISMLKEPVGNGPTESARDETDKAAESTEDVSDRPTESSKEMSTRPTDSAKDVTNRPADSAKVLANRDPESAVGGTARPTESAKDVTALSEEKEVGAVNAGVSNAKHSHIDTMSSDAEAKPSVDPGANGDPVDNIKTTDSAPPPVVVVSKAESVDNNGSSSSSNKSESSDTSGSQSNTQGDSPNFDRDTKLSKDKISKGNAKFYTKTKWEKAMSFYRSPRVDIVGLLQKEKTIVKALPGIDTKSLNRPALKRSSTTLTHKPTRASTLRKTSSLKSVTKDVLPSKPIPPTLGRSSTTLAKVPLSALPPIQIAQDVDEGRGIDETREAIDKAELIAEKVDMPVIKVQEPKAEAEGNTQQVVTEKTVENTEGRPTEKPRSSKHTRQVPDRPIQKPKSSKLSRQNPKESVQKSQRISQVEKEMELITQEPPTETKEPLMELRQPSGKTTQESLGELRQPSGRIKKPMPVIKKPLPKQPTLTPKPLVRSKTSVKLTSGNNQKPQGPVRSTSSLQITKTNKTVISKQNDPIRSAVLKTKAEKETAQQTKSKMAATGKAVGRRRSTVAPPSGRDKVQLQKKLEAEKGMPLDEMPEDVQRAFHKACAKAQILAKSNVALTVKAQEQPRPDSRTADWHQEAPEFLLESTQRLEGEKRPNSTGASPRDYALAELKRIQADFDEERYDKARYRSGVVLERTRDAPVGTDFTETEKQNVLANLHSLQGNACLELGLMEEALDGHLKDLGIGTDFGLLDSKSRALSNVGRVHARAGRFRDAIDVWNDKVALCVSAGERAWLFHEMGRCYYELSEYADAQELADKSCVNANETTDTHMQFQACYLLAQCYEKLQALEEALIEYKKSLDLAVVSDNEEEVEKIEAAIQDLNAKLAGQIVEKRVRRRVRMAKVKKEDETGPLTARGITVDGLPSGKSSPTSDLYYLTMLYVMATLPEY